MTSKPETISTPQGGVAPPDVKNDLYSTTGQVGMKELYSPQEPIVDFVFVHGLTGNRETTWTHQNGTMWPEALLANSFPRARIMTFGYDADVFKIRVTAGGNGLLDNGKLLARAIANIRSQLKDQNQDRPIIFITHSLGGLVCEQALLECRKAESSTPQLLDVLRATRGIVFMGTPHNGSNLASWGITVAKISAPYSFHQQTDSQVSRS